MSENVIGSSIKYNKMLCYIKELVANNVNAHEIACWTWKMFSGKFVSKHGHTGLIGYSPETCWWCGETYNSYAWHECNVPVHDIVTATIAIEAVYPDVSKIAEIMEGCITGGGEGVPP